MRDDQKKIVVTGASGFLGRHLVDRLWTDGGFAVCVLSSRGENLQKNNADGRVVYRHKDDFITDNEVLRHSIIVNCAFPRNSTGTGMADGLHYIRQLFDCAADSGAEAIINISSQSIYSQMRTEAATEEMAVCLESPYAVGKYATELMLESACRGSKTKFTNLRMASLIGPGFDQRIVNRFVRQGIETGELTVNRSRQKFGFLDVEDAVEALYRLLVTDPGLWKPIYNVGNGKEYTIEYMALRIKDVFTVNGLKAPKVIFEDREGAGSTGVACRMLMDDTGFEPSVDLDASIQKILDSIINKQY